MKSGAGVTRSNSLAGIVNVLCRDPILVLGIVNYIQSSTYTELNASNRSVVHSFVKARALKWLYTPHLGEVRNTSSVSGDLFVNGGHVNPPITVASTLAPLPQVAVESTHATYRAAIRVVAPDQQEQVDSLRLDGAVSCVVQYVTTLYQSPFPLP